jgi:hypothetical protein
MRRLLVLGALALALVVPAVSHADKPKTGEGCLVVTNAYGVVSITARGALIGRVGDGTVTIEDLNPNDSSKPKVSGNDPQLTEKLTKTKTRFTGGPDLRFRLTGGGPFRIVVDATDVNLSVVGWGRAVLNGSAFPTQPGGGSYSADAASLCSGNIRSFPTTATTVSFGSPGSG